MSDLSSALTSVRQINMELLTIDNNIFSLETPHEEKLFNREFTEK